ncbi:MAG: flagellar hook protein FlgE [Rhodospirillales bacterium]|nr:flagellar hook protein FlgE [Rhodospirillales bacterium]
MSIFGALDTAVSGLNAQAASFSNISDNIANSQTVGFKSIGTSFEDYLTQSTATVNESGSVVAHPQYQNALQGTITQNSNPTSLAISGQGFFAVSRPGATTTAGSASETFRPGQYFTRDGTFSENANGYLVNDVGDALNGWPVDPVTGQANTSSLVPIQIAQTPYPPVATSTMNLSANLPATPTSLAPITSQVSVYDALGTAHTVALDWTQLAPNSWQVSINVPDDTVSAARGTAVVNFGPTASGNPVADGTIGSITGASGSVTASSYSANGPATLSFTADLGGGAAQNVTLNLGSFGSSAGLTQYAGSSFDLTGLTQNGLPAGSVSSVSTTSAGDVVVNYSNGQSQTVAQVPVVTFANPDALQRQDGQAFTATIDSGNALVQAAGTNGAGTLVTSADEQSNVDIASEFTHLIVAQQAYTANTKTVTTANQMMQATINMMG